MSDNSNQINTTSSAQKLIQIYEQKTKETIAKLWEE